MWCWGSGLTQCPAKTPACKRARRFETCTLRQICRLGWVVESIRLENGKSEMAQRCKSSSRCQYSALEKWLSHLTVTQENTGSNPVCTANMVKWWNGRHTRLRIWGVIVWVQVPPWLPNGLIVITVSTPALQAGSPSSILGRSTSQYYYNLINYSNKDKKNWLIFFWCNMDIIRVAS